MQAWGRFGALMTAAGAGAILAAPVQAEAQGWRFRAEPVLGTYLDLVAMSADRATARVAAEAAMAEIARLDAILSGWREDSELSGLNRAARMQVSPELFEVLSACERWRAETGGAFDARQGEAFALRRRDPAADVAALWAAAADAPVSLDPATRTVVRPAPVRFAPEALAKGYVVDRALAAARAAAPGLSGLMLDIGGDLRACGRGPGGGWVAGVSDGMEDNAAPAVRLRLGERALATSGRRDAGFHHILGGEAVWRASVVAPTAAEADALSTALCAMPGEAALDLVDRLPGAEARIVGEDGMVGTSGGWDALVAAPPRAALRPLRIADVAAAPWPAGFAVRIDYELPRIAARAHPPYVAVWVTDENAKLIRGLTMLGPKLDYVGENYIWWRRYGRSHPQLVAAISRPTKPPGRYTLIWDGKDDMGQAVGQGRYSIHIEATREDGSHSYQSLDLVLGSDPVSTTAETGDELGPATARYGRR